MAKAGDVVIVEFPGAHLTKRRPAVVVSSDSYHQTRPDVILGILTSNSAAAIAPSDCLIQDLKSAGLRQRSAFRAFLVTMPASKINIIGQLSAQDWQSVQSCLKNALA